MLRVVSRLTLMFKIVHGLIDVKSQILVKSGRSPGQTIRTSKHTRIDSSSFFPSTHRIRVKPSTLLYSECYRSVE